MKFESAPQESAPEETSEKSKGKKKDPWGAMDAYLDDSVEKAIKEEIEDITKGNHKTDKGLEKPRENDIGHGTEEKLPSIERRDGVASGIETMDQIFIDLLEVVKDAPEAKQEALKILIQHIQETGEQIKRIRDAKHLQELKVLMVQHWRELEVLVGGDKKILEKIQDWGKRFVESKILYYEFIGDVKDEIADCAQEIRENLGDVYGDIGEISALTRSSLMKSIFNIPDWYGRPGAESFLAKITNPDNFYSSGGDFGESDITSFLERLNGALLESSQAVAGMLPGEPERKKEAQAALGRLKEHRNNFTESVKKVNKILKVLKKIRDTHFLPLYNEHPGIEELDAQAA